MKIHKGAKLLFVGDSITDCGRTRPIAEGLHNPLGNGYVNIVNGLLGAFCPGLGIRVVNMGHAGDQSRNLKLRWQADVLDLKPDWLSLMTGVNDIWRQFDIPYIKEKHIFVDEYEATLDELLTPIRPSLKGLVLMRPHFIEPNRNEPMRVMIDQYALAVKRLAQKHDAIYVDTQAYFDVLLQHCHPAEIAWDRVHPNVVGHSVFARAFLDAVEFPWHGSNVTNEP